ncbi:hypothetical protein [Martelella sp. HB161492]|uniref:hypothetical protein n=1 Tax=Martelella sp. HB161492 TaxID=2720726 RepID=UPI00158FF450|nr:hypothetical protein [Martelella sp. HB161492]
MAHKDTQRSSLIAAGIILAVMVIGGLFLPEVVNLLGRISPFLGFGFGVLFVLALFIIFWLRARYQRRH